MGLTIPAMTALAQEAGRRSPGTAASLKGGMTLLTGALVTPLTGVVGYDSLLPLALLMTVFFSAAFTLVRVVDARPGTADTAADRRLHPGGRDDGMGPGRSAPRASVAAPSSAAYVRISSPRCR
jgi:hypothetical protein